LIDEVIRKDLMKAGAAVVGFAEVKNVLREELAHLGNAISIGVKKNLNEDSLGLMGKLQKKAASILKRNGYRYLSIPPDSDRISNTFVSKLYPSITHKIAATSAGLGWIGRNGLLISPEHGPRLSLGTVLTDAPLHTAEPVESCLCGECSLCIDHCPSGALTGNRWSRSKPFVEIIMLDRCSTHKKKSKSLTGKPNCGLCINICPYGRKFGSFVEEVR
jgi:epoxyqueuosine reductase QueG